MILSESKQADYSDGWEFIKELVPNIVISADRPCLQGRCQRRIRPRSYDRAACLGICRRRSRHVRHDLSHGRFLQRAGRFCNGCELPESGHGRSLHGLPRRRGVPAGHERRVRPPHRSGRHCAACGAAGPQRHLLYRLDFQWAGAGKENVIAQWDEIATNVITAAKKPQKTEIGESRRALSGSQAPGRGSGGSEEKQMSHQVEHSERR